MERKYIFRGKVFENETERNHGGTMRARTHTKKKKKCRFNMVAKF